MEAQEPATPTPSPQKRQRYHCPVCRRPIVVCHDDASKRLRFFPFCSERCKLVDLGAWFDGDYRIPAHPADASEELPTEDEPA